MAVPARLFFGSVRFTDGQELLEFQYRVLMVLLAFGALAGAAILGAGATGAVPLATQFLCSTATYTVTCGLLWLFLRGRSHLSGLVVSVSQLAIMVEFAWTLAWVPGNPLLILAVLLNIPVTYLLMGRTAGGVVTAIYAVGLLAGNRYLAAPLPPVALASALFAMAFLAALSHACAKQLVHLYRHLYDTALQDALTGTLSGRAYYAVCDRMIRASRRASRPYAVLFIDLDHFSAINDRWGHDAGDQVLKSVAGCLSINLRRSDVVGRIGGEEFSVFLPDTDLAGAHHLAESLRAAIEALMPWIGERRLQVTASLGVAVTRPGVLSMRELQVEADEAMYRAKAVGRNRVSSFGDEDRVTSSFH